jgi:hypothetical protein
MKTTSNSYKDIYYTKNIAKINESQAERFYGSMRNNPEKIYNSNDIAKMFGDKNRGIATRIFEVLLVNNLIVSVNIADSNYKNYKIISPDLEYPENPIKPEIIKSLNNIQKQILTIYKNLLLAEDLNTDEVKKVCIMLNTIVSNLKIMRIKEINVVNYLSENMETLNGMEAIELLMRVSSSWSL